MCFHTQITKLSKELESRFKAKFAHPEQYSPSILNAFNFPLTPIIAGYDQLHIQMYHWGLMPSWAKDKTSIGTSTLNARLETIREKPSFRDYVPNRCLVLADGFFEWQWLDPAGKKKQKYLLQLPDAEPFGLAGLYNHWTDPETGEVLQTFTVITTQANELMSKIHNSKQRMPILVRPSEEETWLSGGKLYIQKERLEAIPV